MGLDGNGAKQYRMIKCKENVAQVMSMYDNLTSVWNSNTSKTTTMDTLTVVKYEDSDIDTYLNTTWYNTLTSAIKAAIIPETVICDAWYYSDSIASGDVPVYSGTYGDTVPGTNNYSIGKYVGRTLNIGERNVFALGVQDVIDYLNNSSVQVDTTAILRNVNIWKMFQNDEVQHSVYLGLRFSDVDDSDNVWSVFDSDEHLGYIDVNFSVIAWPALNLDLSKIFFPSQLNLLRAESIK